MIDTGVDTDLVDDPENLARTAMERSNLHGFLATVFREELNAELLSRIRSDDFHGALGAAGAKLDTEFLGRPEGELLEQRAVEYTALFLGPGGHISPHESVHTSDPGGGSLWGKPTVEVKRFIEFAGFEYKESYHGLPDHISVELEFMADVVGREAAAWREDRRDRLRTCLEFEDRFMADHLAKWLPAFCRKVVERAELPFYREMAGLTADFLEAEKAEIAHRLKIVAKER